MEEVKELTRQIAEASGRIFEILDDCCSKIVIKKTGNQISVGLEIK